MEIPPVALGKFSFIKKNSFWVKKKIFQKILCASDYWLPSQSGDLTLDKNKIVLAEYLLNDYETS